MPKMKIVEFANSVDLDVAAHLVHEFSIWYTGSQTIVFCFYFEILET